jgi:hypothetical protein
LLIALNRKLSSITHELGKGMDNGMDNLIVAESGRFEPRMKQRPHFTMTDEAWHGVKVKLDEEQV